MLDGIFILLLVLLLLFVQLLAMILPLTAIPSVRSVIVLNNTCFSSSIFYIVLKSFKCNFKDVSKYSISSFFFLFRPWFVLLENYFPQYIQFFYYLLLHQQDHHLSTEYLFLFPHIRFYYINIQAHCLFIVLFFKIKYIFL